MLSLRGGCIQNAVELIRVRELLIREKSLLVFLTSLQIKLVRRKLYYFRLCILLAWNLQIGMDKCFV
jgi:hypothetical protein